MNSFPKVSILTACYNASEYLQRYLDSILQQTYPNIELILVNDGSVDNTAEIIDINYSSFNQRGYSLVSIYTPDLGAGGAFDAGLKYVTGEYFSWCDPDDFLSPDYVSQKVSYFQTNPDVSLVRCNGYCVEERNINSIICPLVTDEIDKKSLNLFLNSIDERHSHISGNMVRTVDFDQVVANRSIYPSRFGQNWQLLLPMFYYFKTGFIDLPLIYIVERSASHSRSVNYKSPIGKRIDRFNGYEDILLHTIPVLNLPPNEEVKLINHVRIKYIRIRMREYASVSDINHVRLEFEMLKELTTPSLNDKITLLVSPIGKCVFAFKVPLMWAYHNSRVVRLLARKILTYL